MCMIAIADKEGFVDETVQSLARKFNVPVNIVNNAIKIFLKPDESSRSITEDGRRLRKIRKSFGWQIINYQYYRDLRTSRDRTAYMKDYMKKYRKDSKQKSLQAANVNTGKPPETHTDTDTYKRVLSQLLLDLISERRPNLKKPDIIKWAEHIDLMIRVDKRDPEEIKTVIEWCQADEFWQNNILSTAKLRKQYDQLALKADVTQDQGTRMACKECGDSGRYAGIDDTGVCTKCRLKK